MIIKGIQKLTLIDYPGKIACTLFTFGCNFRCPFCFNSSLVVDDSTPAVREEEMMKFLHERSGWLEGVCVSGGEPTLHGDLPEFIERVRGLGYRVKLDTNGTSPKMLEKLLNEDLLDYVAVDVKAPLQKYSEVVRAEVNVEDLRRTLELVIGSGVEHEVRTTVVPTIHSKQDIVAIAREVGAAKVYFLQQFRPIKTLDPRFMDVKPYPIDYLIELRDLCSRYVPTRVRV